VGCSGGSRDALVDVGIPVAGRAEFVAFAIESVLAQTLPEWRLTISEDGLATGSVRGAVEPYLLDQRICYTNVGERIGAPANKTRLIASGASPYVALLDDDDCWKPCFLERHVALLEQHPGAGAVFCSNDVIDSRGDVIGHAPLVLSDGVYSPREFLPRLLTHDVMGSPTVLVRRAAYASVGSVFESRMQTNYDYDMWIRIAAKWWVGYRARRDACYREHARQATVQQRMIHADEMLLLLARVPQHLQGSGVPVPHALLRRQRTHWLLSSALNQIEEGQTAAALRRLSAAVRCSPLDAAKDPKLAAVVAAAGLGPFGRTVLGGLRMWKLRHGLGPRALINALGPFVRRLRRRP
jgi:Glycosyl transferase family 2